MKFVCLILALFSLQLINSQSNSVKGFKYIVIQSQYGFQNEVNEYRLNELIQFELEKYDLASYMNTSVLPIDVNKGSCNTLFLEVIKSGTLKQTLTFNFNDCSQEVIASVSASSRIKKFDKAYFEATRRAMVQLADFVEPYQDSKPDLEDEFIESTQKEESEKIIERRISESVQIDNDSVKLTYKRKDGKLELLKDDELYAVARLTRSGSYIVQGETMSGVGFFEGEVFIVEYFENNQSKLLRFTSYQ